MNPTASASGDAGRNASGDDEISGIRNRTVPVEQNQEILQEIENIESEIIFKHEQYEELARGLKLDDEYQQSPLEDEKEALKIRIYRWLVKRPRRKPSEHFIPRYSDEERAQIESALADLELDLKRLQQRLQELENNVDEPILADRKNSPIHNHVSKVRGQVVQAINDADEKSKAERIVEENAADLSPDDRDKIKEMASQYDQVKSRFQKLEIPTEGMPGMALIMAKITDKKVLNKIIRLKRPCLVLIPPVSKQIINNAMEVENAKMHCLDFYKGSSQWRVVVMDSPYKSHSYYGNKRYGEGEGVKVKDFTQLKKRLAEKVKELQDDGHEIIDDFDALIAYHLSYPVQGGDTHELLDTRQIMSDSDEVTFLTNRLKTYPKFTRLAGELYGVLDAESADKSNFGKERLVLFRTGVPIEINEANWLDMPNT